MEPLYETEIECSTKKFNPLFGKDRASLVIFPDKLKIRKINTRLNIPDQILISDIANIKLKFSWRLQLRIEIFFTQHNKKKSFSFVTGNVADKIVYVSTPFKTYKVYKIIEKRIIAARWKFKRENPSVCPKCGSSNYKMPNPLRGTIGSVTLYQMVQNVFLCRDCGYQGYFLEVNKKDVKKFREDLKKKK